MRCFTGKKRYIHLGRVFKYIVLFSGKFRIFCKFVRFDKQYGELPLGYDHKYVYSHFGYNMKATNLQAAIGSAQLEKFPVFVERRKQNFKRLYDGLADMQDKFILPEACEHSEPSWFGFLLTCKEGIQSGRRVDEYRDHNGKSFLD